MSAAADRRIAELEAELVRMQKDAHGAQRVIDGLRAEVAALKADAVRRDASDEAGELAQSWMRKVGEEVKAATECEMEAEGGGEYSHPCHGDNHMRECPRAALLRHLLGPKETQRQADASHHEALRIIPQPFNINPVTFNYWRSNPGLPVPQPVMEGLDAMLTRVYGPTLEDVANHGTQHYTLEPRRGLRADDLTFTPEE